MAIDVFSDGHDELLRVPEDAMPKLIAGQGRKKRSTMFSHEAEVGVNLTYGPTID